MKKKIKKKFGRLKFDVYVDVNLFTAIKVLDRYRFVFPNSYSRKNKVFIGENTARIYLVHAYIYIVCSIVKVT